MKNSKKRILYFVPEFPRLSETFIEREISKLIEFDNLDITLLSLSKASGKMSSNVAEHVVYRRLKFVDFIKSLVGVFSKPLTVCNIFKIISRDKNKSFIQRFYFGFKCIGYAHVFSEYYPDHIHVHFLSDPSTIALVASKILKVPYSISGHARDVFVDGTLIPSKVKTAKFITLCNGFAWQKCIDLAGKDSNTSTVHKIYHGVPQDIKTLASLAIEKPSVPVIFCIGRLVEKKGQSYLIEASKILKDKGLKHLLYIAGGGPLYDELSSKVHSYGLEEVIKFIGDPKTGPLNDVAMSYMQIADVYTLPAIETSEGDADGVPTTVIEAAMAQLPIVVTNAGGITDLIENDVTGVIVPQKDALELANALERVLKDKVFASTLAKNVRERAVKMFDMDTNIRALEELLLN